jgi:translation initiation factor 2B subunit (eIF-2B alpha/beta/delta family)
MATWNEFCSDVSRISKKAAKKTGALAHSASLHIKLENHKAKLSSSYEKLGRLTYKQLKTAVSQAEAISEVIATIDSIRADVSVIEKEIEEEKAKKAAEKEEEKAEKAAKEAEKAEETSEEA